jgi:hypothetical protein
MLTPNERFSFGLGYTCSEIYFQMLECWAYGLGVTFPVAPGLLPSAFGGTVTYSSKTHFAYADVMWKPIKRLTLKAG